MKQLTWLRIVHSGDWCLALQAPGVPEKNEWIMAVPGQTKTRRQNTPVQSEYISGHEASPAVS